MNEELSVVATGDTSGAQKSLKDLQSELGKTAVAATKTDSSLATMANGFQKVGSIANSTLHRAIRTTVEDTTNLGSAFGSIASEALGVLGPLGLLAGAFAIPKIVRFIESLTQAGESEKIASENLANLNAVMEEADKQAGKQIASLKILYDTATNVNIPIKERIAAVKELQKEFPDYFKNLSQENILNGDAAIQYKLLTAEIIKNAQAKASLNKIEALSAQLLDNEFKKQKILNATTAEAARIQKTTFQNTGIGQNAAKFRKENLDIVEARKKTSLSLIDQNNKDIQSQIDFLTKFASLPSLAKVIEDADKKKPKKEKNVDPFTVDLKALGDYYKNQQAKYVGLIDYELAVTKDYLEKKKLLLEKYGKDEGANNLAIAQNERKIHEQQLKFLASQVIPSTLQKPEGLDTTQKIQPKIKIFPSDEIIKEKEAMDALTQQMEATGQILEKTLLPAFDALFTSIIDGSNRSGQSFTKMLSNLIKQLEKTIVKALALAAIESIFGGPTFGTAFDKALGLSNVFGGHASGTSNFEGGGTWVGEHGKEFVTLPRGSTITPAAQLSGMGNDRIFIASYTLRGPDILTTFNRATAQAGRNG